MQNATFSAIERVDEIEPQRASARLRAVSRRDARLHERRMQVQVVRHHRGAEYGDGDVEACRIQTR